jgi:hypothetical protein
MHEAAERYLALVERELKKIPGIKASEATSETRDLLADDLKHTTDEAPDLDSRQMYERIVERLGQPEEVATAYRERSDRVDAHPVGYAPGWRLVCPSCGRSTPAAHAGFLRVGAWSWFRFVLGFCRACRRPRLLRLVKDI